MANTASAAATGDRRPMTAPPTGLGYVWRGVALALALVLPLVAPLRSAEAANAALDRIDVVSGETGIQIHIRFNIAIRYLRHVPPNRGRSIEIELRELTSPLDLNGAADSREILGFVPTEDTPLLEAIYERDVDQTARLTLSFSRIVAFEIADGRDSRSIIIKLLPEKGAAVEPSPGVEGEVVAPTQPIPAPEALPVPVGAEDEKLAAAMKEAADAMTAGDIDRAIQLYTKILQATPNPYQQQALELLGLARERNGQRAHAKAEYEDYLRQYPAGEGAERVRQRLAALLTADLKPKEKLRQPEEAAGEEMPAAWDIAGSLAAYYTRDQDISDSEGARVNESSLETDVDLTARYSGDGYEATARGSGGHLLDLLGDGQGNEGRLSTLYVEVMDAQTDTSIRAGRQTRSTGGVFGRFDGALLGYRLTPEIKVNLAAGLPVEGSTDLYINDAHYFGAIALDVGPIAEAWNGNVFLVEQRSFGILDRRATGAELRYANSDFTAFGLVDYDLSYNALNIALASANWFFPDQTTLSLSLDYRTTPLLTTTNALIGQPVNDMGELLDLFSEGQVRALAEDRTGISRTVTLGASRPLNETWQVSGDITATYVTGTEASASVDEIPSPGLEMFYSAQIAGSNLFKEGDLAAVAVRFNDQADRNRYTLDINTRYPVNESLRLNPRLRFDYQTNDDDGGNQITLRPSLRLNYAVKENVELEVDTGGEWNLAGDAGAGSEQTLGFYAIIGLRYDF